MPKFEIEIANQKFEVEAANEQALPDIAETLSERVGSGEIGGKAVQAIGPPPPRLQRLGTRARRLGALTTKSLVGDIPFIGENLPKAIQDLEPAFPSERLIPDVAKFGRDIVLLKGIGKLGVLRTALRGAGIGILTADSENPQRILKSSVRGAIALPLIKKGAELASGFITKFARKGLKTAQQAWQDLARAGFTVEKATVERIQQKGIGKIFGKKTGLRDDDAFLKLGTKVFNKAQNLRREAGKTLARWRQQAFKDPKVKVKIDDVSANFQRELQSPQIGILDRAGNIKPAVDIGTQTARNTLVDINNQLSGKSLLTPQEAQLVIDKLDDLVTATKRGTFSIGKNEGRIVSSLRRELKESLLKSAPRKVQQGLRNAESRFGEVADATDDVFDRLPLRKEGVALKERIGGTERSLQRGLKTEATAEERAVFEKLENLLPKSEKFMELYKDIFAAQDLQREGIGWLLRRLFLAPRAFARGFQTVQPATRAIGAGIRGVGRAAEVAIPPTLLRRATGQQDTPQ